MKSIHRSNHPVALLMCAALSAVLSACVGPAPSATPSAPRPALAAPRPAPPATGPVDWHDLPATPGVWQWRREGRLSIARFGDAADPGQFRLICDPLAGAISLSRRAGSGTATAMSIFTTTLSRRIAAPRSGDGAMTAMLSPRDPLLDAMAFSRGRFAATVPGLTPLYLPSWPEISRVIEDCRDPGWRAP